MFRKKPKNVSRQAPQTAKNLPPTFSYYSAGGSHDPSSPDQSNQSSKRSRPVDKHASRLSHLPSYLAAVLIIVSLFYALSLSTAPKVVIGNQTGSNLARNPDVYQSRIQSILAETALNRTKLTINTTTVAQAIQASFPEIDRVEVTLPLLGRRPIVGLDLGQPTLVLVGNNGSFVVGQDGRALIRTADLGESDKLKLPTVYDQSGLSLEQGKAILPKQSVDFITTVVDQLRAKHLVVESMTLPAIANELHVKIAGVPYLIKYNLQGDARLQTGVYLAVVDKLTREGTPPQEYVDVRLDNRAYYK